MAISKNICDREYQKFEECPTGTDQPAVRTKICQNPGESIKVEVVDDGDTGTVIATYAEVGSIPTMTITDIVSYTVPVSSTFFLKEVSFSGDSVGEVTVEFDSVTEEKQRVDYLNWNGRFLFYNQMFTAGQVIRMRVEHCSTTAGEFNGRIIGNLVT